MESPKAGVLVCYTLRMTRKKNGEPKGWSTGLLYTKDDEKDEWRAQRLEYWFVIH